MAGNKYLKNNAGQIQEVAAAQSSAGAGDANKIVALDANGKLHSTMMPTGFGDDVTTLVAGESLSAGDWVNVYNDSGTAKMRKADASTSGKEAHAFVLAAVVADASGTAYFEGANNQVTGQTPGVVFLSASVPGAGTGTAPSGAGQTVQRIGFATSATAVNFQSNDPILLA